MLRTSAEDLKQQREKFEKRDTKKQREGSDDTKPLRKTTTYARPTITRSVWWDELEGPYISREGHEYMLARETDPNITTMRKIFTDELNIYTSVDGRQYVEIVYAV